MKLETPKPNLKYYNHYRFIGLMSHPYRLLNYIKFKISKFKADINYYPLLMDIEPTQRCNYQCIMCDPTVLFKVRRKDMTFEQFKRIIDEQKGLIEVKIQGVGEPLLNKDFIKMVDYALSRKLWVRTTLNGSLLHQDDIYKQIIDTGIHDINISCDGASKDVYEKIRFGGDFENFKCNSRLINEYNASCGNKVPVRAWVVLQEENKHEFLNFPEFFASIGYTEMCISFAMHNYGRDDENSNSTDFQVTDSDFEKIIELGQRHKIAVKFWAYPKMSRSNFCKIPFQRIYLTTDMHIVPCCYIANQEIVDWGEYSNFKDVWFKKYIPFRKSHNNKTNKLFTYCEKCYSAEEH